MMEILFLGTNASVPSRSRNPPCVAVRCGSDIVLFDCGEGSQKQLMISPFSFMKVVGIFITHMHGDHILGLPGLLQTMGLSGRKDPLVLCGPEGFGKSLNSMLSACEGGIEYPLDVRDVCEGDSETFKGFSVKAVRNEHGVSSVGYVMREDDVKGKFDKAKAESLGISPGPDFSVLKGGGSVGDVTSDMVTGPSKPGCSIVYSGDTVPCDFIRDAAKDADVLIHESTYSGSEANLAKEHKHSTSVQAAQIARDSGCKALILTHVSNRYDDRESLRREAAEIFENVFMAEEMGMFILSKNNLRSV